MSVDIGPRIGIDGEAEFRKELASINTGLKTLGTEMKAVTSAFIGNENSSKALTAQDKVLEKQVEALKQKLKLQTDALERSKQANGEDAAATQKLQQEVNKTTAALNKANADLKSNEEALKNNGKAAEETAEKHEGAMGKIAAVTGTAMKAVGAALAAGVGAIAALAKSALGGYGEYEQLVGGVETLFGAGGKSLEEYAREQGKTVEEAAAAYKQLETAQGEVLANADKAYKTAGLSANEYMDTVTSFSAALISSLGGDTEKAAKVADQAITDMADNANKMGSSMESIQNAYQGFAKQNYTMLDNLKLGYGGTKEEMKRLLSDAEKLTGQKFDLENYADIVEAIHAIQTEMGITGTTAKEAEKTIQGSASAMKSAWKNLVTGFGDENADLDQLIKNLVESVFTVIDNVIPRLEIILAGVGQAIQNLAPTLMQTFPALISSVLPSILQSGAAVIAGLVQGIMQALPTLVTSVLPSLLQAGLDMVSGLASGIVDNVSTLVAVVPDLMTSLIDTILEFLPQFLDMGMELLDSLTTGILEALPALLEELPQIIDSIIGFFSESGPKIMDKGLEITKKLTDGILSGIVTLVQSLPQIITSLVDFFSEQLPTIVSVGVELLGNLVIGIINAIPELVAALPQIIQAIVSGMASLMGGIINVGKNIVHGIWEGITGASQWLWNKIKEFCASVLDKIKEFFGISSPSKVTKDVIGYNLDAGISEGIEDGIPRVKHSVAELNDAIMSGMDAAQLSLDSFGGTFNLGDLSGGMDLTIPRGNQEESFARMASSMVNGLQTALTGMDWDPSGTIVLQAGDGTELARWFLPSLRSAMKANPEVVSGV